jgi:hypothetical protein
MLLLSSLLSVVSIVFTLFSSFSPFCQRPFVFCFAALALAPLTLSVAAARPLAGAACPTRPSSLSASTVPPQQLVFCILSPLALCSLVAKFSASHVHLVYSDVRQCWMGGHPTLAAQAPHIILILLFQIRHLR